MKIDLSERQLTVLIAVLEFALEKKMLDTDQVSVVRALLIKGQATLNQDYLSTLMKGKGGEM